MIKSSGGKLGIETEEKPMQKIEMKTPLVEMDGDEMTRVLWKIL